MSFITHRRMRKHALSMVVAAATWVAVAVPVHASDRVNIAGLQPAETYDRFIVKYREESPARRSHAALVTALERAAHALPATKGRGLQIRHSRRLAVGADVIRTGRKLDRIEAEILMRQIAADPAVEYVELDRINRPTLIPNDSYFSQQYGMGGGAGGIRATEAWDETSGVGIVVAVIDTGIVTHDDLNANLLPGYDFISDPTVSNDGNGRDSNPNDDFAGCPTNPKPPGPGLKTQSSPSGHGNHVAGIIAAVANNSAGVVGVAHGARVLPIRVLAECAGFDSDVADAIVWASGGTVSGVVPNANPAEVINLSLGGSGACGSTFQDAISIARGSGATVVVAAGNGNADVGNRSPANCAGIVAVASTTSTGTRSSFSNYGSGIDIAAPGSDVLSTFLDGTVDEYKSISGTSMAAPHVSGVVALMQAHATMPKTPSKIESLLKETARAFPTTPSQDIGDGIVHASEAVAVVNCVSPGIYSDFDCDGQADVLWRNTSTGDNEFWPNADQGDEVALTSAATSWEAVGIGDFDGDSRADILWRNTGTGGNSIWFSGKYSTSELLHTVPNQAWEVAGVGDFDDDGESDILWWNSSDGNVDVWPSGDSGEAWDAGAASVLWKIQGVGDFDGDGESDIVWRHSANGEIYLWMGGLETQGAALHTIPNSNWKIEGVGDFDDDGESDILWRNTSSGDVDVWPSGEYAATWDAGLASLSWQIEGVADFNGDGESDIVWRHTNGQNYIWPSAKEIDGYAIQTVTTSNWQIMP